MVQTTLKPYRNKELFSTHYLDEKLEKLDEWSEDEKARKAYNEIKELYENKKERIQTYTRHIPIYYEFESDFAYYPLEITRPVGGSGKVSLFLFTEHNVSGNVFPLDRAQYELEDGSSEPVEFHVTGRQLKWIDNRISDLFAFENGVRFTVFNYEGPMTGFDRDFVLRDGSESSDNPSKINFNPQIEIKLGKSAVILAVLIGVLTGVGGFLGTYLGSKRSEK